MNTIEDVNPAQAYMVGMLYAAFGWRVKAGDSMLRSASVRMASLWSEDGVEGDDQGREARPFG